MARKVYISGRMLPETEARISIFDSAVMLADTVTESTRTFRHKPFKLEQHIERVQQVQIRRHRPSLSLRPT